MYGLWQFLDLRIDQLGFSLHLVRDAWKAVQKISGNWELRTIEALFTLSESVLSIAPRELIPAAVSQSGDCAH